jgi:hypothetical protein
MQDSGEQERSLMRGRGSTRGSLGFHRVTTLFRPPSLGSDRSAPCADFQERSDFGSGSTRTPCRPIMVVAS